MTLKDQMHQNNMSNIDYPFCCVKSKLNGHIFQCNFTVVQFGFQDGHQNQYSLKSDTKHEKGLNSNP